MSPGRRADTLVNSAASSFCVLISRNPGIATAGCSSSYRFSTTSAAPTSSASTGGTGVGPVDLRSARRLACPKAACAVRWRPRGAVGTDIAHVAPLTLVVGIGNWIIGSIDRPLLGSCFLPRGSELAAKCCGLCCPPCQPILIRQRLRRAIKAHIGATGAPGPRPARRRDYAHESAQICGAPSTVLRALWYRFTWTG